MSTPVFRDYIGHELRESVNAKGHADSIDWIPVGIHKTGVAHHIWKGTRYTAKILAINAAIELCLAIIPLLVSSSWLSSSRAFPHVFKQFTRAINQQAFA